MSKGSTRVAMRTGAGSGTDGLLWLLGDHLGSTSRVANADGTPLANGEQRYKPWGEKRYPTGASGLPTTFRYTGQRQESSLGGTDGLYFYGARWLDPALGRFVQADTLVPGMDNPQRWDRFGYVLNNPVRYNDSTGHKEEEACGFHGEGCIVRKKSLITLPKPQRFDRIIKPDLKTRPIIRSFEDATLFSLSGTVGFGNMFYTAGIDIVSTPNRIGVFTVSGAGSTTGGSFVSGADYSVPEEDAFVTPQLSGSALYGNLYGDSLTIDVQNYDGTAIVAGGSIGPGTVEYISSVSEKTGLPNSTYKGIIGGPSFGLQPVEVHSFYTNAIYQPAISDFLTFLFR
jgi:RHS repeat-associated protein